MKKIKVVYKYMPCAFVLGCRKLDSTITLLWPLHTSECNMIWFGGLKPRPILKFFLKFFSDSSPESLITHLRFVTQCPGSHGSATDCLVTGCDVEFSFQIVVTWQVSFQIVVTWQISFQILVTWQVSFQIAVTWQVSFQIVVIWQVSYQIVVTWQVSFQIVQCTMYWLLNNVLTNTIKINFLIL